MSLNFIYFFSILLNFTYFEALLCSGNRVVTGSHILQALELSHLWNSHVLPHKFQNFTIYLTVYYGIKIQTENIKLQYLVCILERCHYMI